MTPFYKCHSSQSTCSSTLEQQPQTTFRRELHPHSNQSVQQSSETDSGRAALPSSPSPSSNSSIACAAMSGSANNDPNHSSNTTISENTPTPFLTDRGSSDSSHENNEPNSSNNKHPLICHHRHEQHPNYQSPNQFNCSPEYKQDACSCGKKATTLQHHQAMHQHHGNVDDFPTLPFHSHQELSLAERSIKRLVIYSKFFPSCVASDDWFRRPTGDGGDTNPTPAQSNGDEGKMTEVRTNVTTLYEHEIRVGKLLGQGGFCEVRLAHLEDNDSNNEERHLSQHSYAIKYLSPTITKQKSKKAFCRGAADLAIEARFLSLLSHDNIIQLHHVSAGSLRENYNCLDTNEDENEGCCAQPATHWSGSDSTSGQGQSLDTRPRHFGYFLILDRLHETLDHRMKKKYIPEAEFLMGDHPSKHHDRHHCCDPSGNVQVDTGSQQRRWLNNLPLNNLSQWMQQPNRNDACFHDPLRSLLKKRLIILRGIASAVKHLHDHHIIFRDIKPDNIGFFYHHNSSSDETANDVKGKSSNIMLATNSGCLEIPRLFDFGLVKELKLSSRVGSLSVGSDEDAIYKLTGRTGSRRYMSPEVAFSQPYNYKVDIYSFAILLYEMATLIQPFEGYTVHRHEVEILRRGGRPCLLGYDYWPRDLAPLINDCWSGNMKDRPCMDELIQRLDGCIDEMTVPPVPPKASEETPKMSAKSILVGISQVKLSQPQKDMCSPSSFARSGADDRDCGNKSKMRKFLSSVPTTIPAILLQRRKNTAPQA